ncbi:MAG: copper amine oxidase N-terminal domain-containing protein [Bacillota bacterium]
MIILFLTIITLYQHGYALAATPKVVVNNSAVVFDVAPFIKEDRVMVPMRAIFEALGAEVEWNPENKSVTARSGSDIVFLVIGSRTAFRYMSGVDSGMVSVELDAPPDIVNDRTVVPVRFVSESLNATVNWSSRDQTVYITKN